MIKGLFENGSMPALERMVQFTGERHKLLMNNIANLSTPYFKPTDLDPDSFQASLGKAIDRRRSRANPTAGPFDIRNTQDIQFHKDGLKGKPVEMNDNILFHDENDRDLERIMQRLAENTAVHNTALEMMKSRYDIMLTAIRERV